MKAVRFLHPPLTAVLAVSFFSVAFAAEGLDFRPPSGWHFVHQNYEQTGIVGAWAGPNDGTFGQNIVVKLESDNVTLDFETNPERIRAQNPGSQVARQKMALCRGLPAMYVYVTRPFNGHTLIAETVMAVSGATVYMATYSRLSSQQPVPEARSALATLCPKT